MPRIDHHGCSVRPNEQILVFGICETAVLKPGLRLTIKSISDQIAIQVTIQIDVGKGHHCAGALKIESCLAALFSKTAVSQVDIESIWSGVSTDKQIQITIAIKIGKARSGGPGLVLTQT